jgi:hypothetical protein
VTDSKFHKFSTKIQKKKNCSENFNFISQQMP